MSDIFTILEDGSPADTVTFDPLPVGEESTKELTIRKETDGVLVVKDVSVNTSGSGDVTVDRVTEELDDADQGELVLTVSAIDGENLNGIEANIEISAQATVYP